VAGGAAPSPDVLIAWQGVAGFTHLAGDFQMVFIAVLTGAFSLGAWRTGIVPRWVSGVGLAVAIAATVGTAGVTLNSSILYGFWFGGLVGWVLWIPLTGIALAMRARSRQLRPDPELATVANEAAPAG